MMNKLLKDIKGFSLVECVVALLIFSIITGSVLTVFSVSRNQIRRQNENHKLDILASNILTTYEASETIDDFSRIAQNHLGININVQQAPDITVPLGGGSGAGSIPVKVPYDYIRVNKGQADFLAKNTGDTSYSSVISFDGNYSNNKLTAGDSGDIPSEKYSRINHAQMVISGSVKPGAGITKYYTYTITKDGNSKNISIDINNLKIDGKTLETKKTITSNTISDFEEYLLDNGYYLKCIELEKIYKSGKLKIDKNIEKYNYYFQVYDATKTGDDSSSCAPIEDNGKRLYYCITIAKDNYGDNTNAMQCQTDISDIDSKDVNIEKMMFKLSKATITYATADSLPAYTAFTAELKNNGSKFTGDWHFFPWIFYKVSSLHFGDAKNSIYCNSYFNYNDYIPTEDYQSIYYVINKDNKIVLMNHNGDRMFSFDATGKTNPLSSSNCIFKTAEITKKYKNDEDWNLYYQKGSMPLKTFGEIKNEGNVITVYDSANNPFIRFIYKNGSQPDVIPTNLPTDGYIYFGCENFYGEYTVKVITKDKLSLGESPSNEELVEAINEVGADDTVEGIYKFTSKAKDFEIIGAVPNSELSCGVIGQPYAGNVNSSTYYITCGLDGVARQLLIRVTFTDLAKVKKKDENFIEPRIDIWSVDEDKIKENKSLENLQNLIKEKTDVKHEYSYRKG